MAMAIGKLAITLTVKISDRSISNFVRYNISQSIYKMTHIDEKIMEIDAKLEELDCFSSEASTSTSKVPVGRRSTKRLSTNSAQQILLQRSLPKT